MIETDRLVKEFKARGGKVKWVPCGVSGVVVSKSFYARYRVGRGARGTQAAEIHKSRVDNGFRGGSMSTGGGGAAHRVVAVDTAMARGVPI